MLNAKVHFNTGVHDMLNEGKKGNNSLAYYLSAAADRSGSSIADGEGRGDAV